MVLGDDVAGDKRAMGCGVVFWLIFVPVGLLALFVFAVARAFQMFWWAGNAYWRSPAPPALHAVKPKRMALSAAALLISALLVVLPVFFIG